jgi:serine protease Do
LIDAGGLVLGIVNSKISDVAVMEAAGVVPQNVSFAIKGTVATSFLDAHSIAYQSAAEAPEANLADIADKARRFGVYIECP